MLSVQLARKLALALPEAEERDHFGSPSFRVRGKIFALLSIAVQADERAILKLSLADQAVLKMADGQTFSTVPQWGQHGWTCVRLAGVESVIFRGLLLQAWRQIAPKQLIAACAVNTK